MKFAHGAHAALAAVSLAAFFHGGAGAVVTSTDPSQWRLQPGAFDGAFDAVASISVQLPNHDLRQCAGTLLSTGRHVVTAAHCLDQAVRIDLNFRGGTIVAGISERYVHPGWTGVLGNGADIAVLKLDRAIPLAGFALSSTDDVGKTVLLVGYGATGLGAQGAGSARDPVSAPHYGFNTIDAHDFEVAEAVLGRGKGDRRHGEGYVYDFDDGTDAHNALQRLKDSSGGRWRDSNPGLGAGEAISAGGDSGGGDFVWDGRQWRLTGVQSYVWPVCKLPGCVSGGLSSNGYLSISTAVYPHVAWIESVTATPANGWALTLAGGFAIGAVLRRRLRQRQP